jgi:hypothetical protein
MTIDSIPKISNTARERQRGMLARIDPIDRELTSFIASDVCDLSTKFAILSFKDDLAKGEPPDQL